MKEAVTGLVLAGGRGQRMDSADKGLLELNGRPMVAWVIERLAPQVDRLMISANRNLDRYAGFGYPVVADRLPDFPGPLGGLQAALSQTTTPLLVTVPCDSPFLPCGLVARLAKAMTKEHAELAVARVGDRAQRAFCLLRRELLPGLDRYLAAGDRKLGLWHAGLNVIEVDFDDEAEAFANINTPDELARLAGSS